VAVNYAAEVASFNARMSSLGVRDIDRYCWYHAVDLPGDITTPGKYDYRGTVDRFGFPDSMRGMSVLDVGSATGFFAFEFERRGATVVSVELPDLEKLDRFPGQDTSSLLSKIDAMSTQRPAEAVAVSGSAYNAEQLHYYMLDAPFKLCARMLESRVERRYCTVYELSPERLRRTAFDWVFAGDVLVHTLRPFDALVALAGMCAGTLVIAQAMPGSPSDPPAMLYEGGETPGEDSISWWLPNEKCFIQLLRKLGFAEVVAVGDHEGIHRPAGNLFSRRIIHARRAGASAS
jgi:SAM-dependent methyltransferase